MNPIVTPVLALCAALALLHPAPADAQAGKVLRGKSLNEAALIDALAPPEPEERTRSIRVQPAGPSPYGNAPAATVAKKPAAASVLITFETDSADISPSSKATLDVIGRALVSDRLAQMKFSIEGHADPRGGEEYNDRLSQSRADSVVAYLVDNYKIERDRLKPVGRGAHELLNPRNPSAPENRRVTIKTQVE